MARRTLVWHIGLADAPRTVVASNLEAHREALAEAGAQVVATPEEAELATREVLGAGRIEGVWARLCARVWEHKGVSLLSTPDLCAADKDRIRFALDQLADVEVHLVLTVDAVPAQLYGGWLAELRDGRTTGWEKYVRRVLAEPPSHRQAEEFWAGHDVPAVLARWGRTLRPERLHVIASADVATQWRQLLDVAGVAADGLGAVLPAYADPAGVAVLRKVNRQLDEPLPPATLELLDAGDDQRAAMPQIATPTLQPLLARWTQAVAAAGHDLRGDLVELLAPGSPVDLPGPRDQLGTAVDALADALAENARLRAELDEALAENERLDQRRRKLKRRLRAAS